MSNETGTPKSRLVRFFATEGTLLWSLITLVSSYALVIVFFWGHTRTKVDMRSQCIVSGHGYDPEYHRSDASGPSGEFFPISYPCTPSYDLVQWWVNPAVAIFGVALLIGLFAFSLTCWRLAFKTVKTLEAA